LKIGIASAIHADYADSVLTLQPAEIRGTGTSLRIQGKLPIGGNATPTLEANGSVDVRILKIVAPDVESSGTLALEVHASGSAASPQIQGQMQFKDISLTTADAPLGVEKLNGTVDITSDHLQVSKMTGQVGGGQVSVGGSIAYKPALQFNLALQGKSVRLRYPDGLRSVRLLYATAHSSTKGDSRTCDYWVSITTTACNYGGVRLWFICPGCKNGIACRRRCRKLYLSARGHVFACRVCHELTYESTQKSGGLFYELISRPMRIRNRTLAALKRSRASRKQDWLLQRMEWAERVLQLGFVRLPGAAEILGPILASEWRMWHYRDRRLEDA